VESTSGRGVVQWAREVDREKTTGRIPTTGRRTAAEVRLVRIQDTLSLERLLASDALLGDLQARDGARTRSAPRRMPFDSNGTLEEFPSG